MSDYDKSGMIFANTSMLLLQLAGILFGSGISIWFCFGSCSPGVFEECTISIVLPQRVQYMLIRCARVFKYGNYEHLFQYIYPQPCMGFAQYGLSHFVNCESNYDLQITCWHHVMGSNGETVQTVTSLIHRKLKTNRPLWSQNWPR